MYIFRRPAGQPNIVTILHVNCKSLPNSTFSSKYWFKTFTAVLIWLGMCLHASLSFLIVFNKSIPRGNTSTYLIPSFNTPLISLIHFDPHLALVNETLAPPLKSPSKPSSKNVNEQNLEILSRKTLML